MHVAICVKQVIDPDGVNAFALWGRLTVDASGRAFEGAIPLIMNAYDDQAIEAALRLRDDSGDGGDVTITALSVGGENVANVLKHAIAMGCNQSIRIDDPEAAAADGLRTGRLLAAAIEQLGDVDVVLCGRQASDDDQGTVPAVIAEALGRPYVTTAADVRLDGDRLRVKRATPRGAEVVRVQLPAVVTVSNEIGTPRYPTSRGMMAARKHQHIVRPASELGVDAAHRVELVQLMVPDVQGHCEMIDGTGAPEQAAALMRRLGEVGVL